MRLDLAGLDAASDEVLSRRIDVRDDDLQALLRPWGHLGDAGSDHDGAGGTGGRELNEAQFLVHLGIDVGVEADLVDLEGFRPVDVGDGHCHQLKPKVHGGKLAQGSPTPVAPPAGATVEWSWPAQAPVGLLATR